MPEVSDCPFCGMDCPEWHDRPSSDAGRDWNWIQCRGCEARTGEYRDREEAVQAWNKRRRESELRAAYTEVLDIARHTHEARRNIHGQLMDACNRCGLDLRHEVHNRVDSVDAVFMESK